jgi:flagellar basal body-associated protein FliL
LRRRAVTILLLPIIVFVFMVGWIFYWMGKQQDKGSVKSPPVKEPASEARAEEEYVEVGLIEDLMEKQTQS